MTYKTSSFYWYVLRPFLLALLLIPLGAHLASAQSQSSNTSIELGAFFVDAFAAGQGGQSSSFRVDAETDGALISGRAFEGLFATEQWNTAAPIYLQFSKQLNTADKKSASIGLRLAYARLTKYGTQPITPVGISVLQLRYTKPLLNAGPLQVNALLGAGWSGIEQNSSTLATLGAHTQLRLSESFTLRLSSSFNTGLNQNFFDFMSYSLGIGYALAPAKGQKTIPVAPYTDRDRDGVSDEIDRCPDDFGFGANRGCPDRDKDGVVDIDDGCPEIFGSADSDGCPMNDRDGDRVPDEIDQCPDTSGSIARKGCPEALVGELVIDLNERAKSLPFSRGDGDFKTRVDRQLEAVVRTMRTNRRDRYLILGYTDASGPTELNQRLSEERAKAFFDYLVSRGIDADRLQYEGRGELPEDPSLEGVEPHPHRRVEIHLLPKENER